MIQALVALVAITQISTTVRPPGSNAEFHRMADAVEQAAATGDHAKAGRLLGLLPKTKIVYQWDDSKVPAAYRAEYIRARDSAFRDWRNMISELRFEQGAKPDLRITFEPTLAVDDRTGYAAGQARFWSESTNSPRLEGVIGLNRGKPIQPSTPLEVGNEIRNLIGSFLGLGEAPFFGPSMSRTDQPTKFRTEILVTEANSAVSALNYTETLREMVAKKQKIPVSRPKAFTDATVLDLGTINQGEVIQATIQLSNTGSGDLSFQLMPDCGCISATPTGSIPAGGSKLLNAEFDSTEFVGEVTKRIAVFTNDPDKPSFLVPVKAKILPSYRIISPGGDVVVTDSRDAETDLFLVLPATSQIQPTGVSLEGPQGSATMEPWEGLLADPELNEGPVQRKGYRIRIRLENVLSTGRTPVGVLVKTTSEQFPQLRHNLQFQRGIAALPVRLFFGDMGSTPKQASFVVSRPARPFKVIAASSDSSNLTVKVEPLKDGSEHRVTATYDGKALVGPFRASIKVRTDDPNQPEIVVPVTGTVR